MMRYQHVLFGKFIFVVIDYWLLIGYMFQSQRDQSRQIVRRCAPSPAHTAKTTGSWMRRRMQKKKRKFMTEKLTACRVHPRTGSTVTIIYYYKIHFRKKPKPMARSSYTKTFSYVIGCFALIYARFFLRTYHLNCTLTRMLWILRLQQLELESGWVRRRWSMLRYRTVLTQPKPCKLLRSWPWKWTRRIILWNRAR